MTGCDKIYLDKERSIEVLGGERSNSKGGWRNEIKY